MRKDERKYTIADVVRFANLFHGTDQFTRTSVKAFLGSPSVDLGKPGAGPRGARVFYESEVIGIAALLPWAACLGGETQRAAWVSTVRKAFNVWMRSPTTPCWLQIRPGTQPGSRKDRIYRDLPLTKIHPCALVIDIQRLRTFVSQVGADPCAPWND